MKICILQPDYSTSDADYARYDPQRNLQKLLPEDEVVHVFLNKLTTYKQLKALSKQGFDIFVNLCEGYLDWEIPSIDVIHSLDVLNLPYTGPNSILYDPRKPLMKYVAYCAGVSTPAYVEISNSSEITKLTTGLRFPLFVKPASAGDSLGVDTFSLVKTETELKSKVDSLLKEFDSILVEEYVEGREFTVLVAAKPGEKGCVAFTPIEYVFSGETKFKTYAHKTSVLVPENNVPCSDQEIKDLLSTSASNIFTSFEGVGYARLDFRIAEGNKVFFLEINFACSVFYENGFEGSADYILNNDPIGKTGFLKQIIAEGIARHSARQKKYTIQGNSLAGYGIFASKNLSKDEVLFNLETRPHKIVTKRFVKENWNETEKNNFRHYAYPISPEVYILWAEKPEDWAPHNHSCDPNTAFSGLNVVTLRPVVKDEELTIDYAGFLDENLEPFECRCGSKNCRGMVSGKKGNSVTSREG